MPNFTPIRFETVELYAFFDDGRPNNKNEMNSDMRSVHDFKKSYKTVDLCCQFVAAAGQKLVIIYYEFMIPIT